jgi:lysozyme family protein
MYNIGKYNDFVLDKQFESIIDNILLLVESEGKWLDDRTYEWDLKNTSTKDKLEKFLSKIPKEKVKKYFYKILDKIRTLPDKIRKKLLITYSSIFLSIASIGYLTKIDDKVDESSFNRNREMIGEIVKLSKKSLFSESQNLVKNAEGGYSSDRKDRGNYVDTKWGKRFIGTNHGISAPILMEYLGKIPTVDDMKNLTYEEALQIYKKQYWGPQNLSLFNNQSIANLIYDGCVNQGIGAMKDVVRAAYIENGMQLGSLENPFQEKWIKMANTLDHQLLFNSIKSGREKKYKESKTFKTHGTGWLNRLNSLEYKDIEINFEKLDI